ncbi:tyrosine-type recombinase/integrase [Fodinicurvata sediminis]|uniref:tyrosine-type recombinase/integrase n=1 Tax=Fodinicurvata sediminis TaxID=1121832 RepID=UPI0003B52005|nr:integrase family protein [Fodinicurvata sediminis]
MPRLTKTLIEGTKPGDRLIELRDETLRGFHVRVWPGGAKTYHLYYRNNANKERRVKIARCDEMVPDRAREIARDMLEKVRRGEDPAAARQTTRSAPAGETFPQAVEDYITREQKGRKGNATADEVRRTLLAEGKPWKKRTLQEITAADIRKRLEQIRDGDPEKKLKPRPYLANRTFSYLQTFFSWCAEPGIEKVPASPMLGLRRPWDGEESRDRVFTDDEIRALWRTANEMAADPRMPTGRAAGAFLKLLLLTGKRRGKVSAMRRDEVDETWLWTPPRDARRKKGNKRAHAIPLPGLAQRILAGLPAREDNPYYFPGRHKASHLDAGSPLIDEIRARSGIQDFIFHACRHTVETRMAGLKVSSDVRDLLLDHAPKRGSGKDYDHHLYYEEMAEALEAWADAVARIVTETEGVGVLR